MESIKEQLKSKCKFISIVLLLLSNGTWTVKEVTEGLTEGAKAIVALLNPQEKKEDFFEYIPEGIDTTKYRAKAQVYNKSITKKKGAKYE